MTTPFTPVSGLLATLDLLQISQADAVLHVRLNRPAKRNAISDALIQQIHTCMVNLPEATKAVVVSGEGAHFCAGLDLAELVARDQAQSEGLVTESRMAAVAESTPDAQVRLRAFLEGRAGKVVKA